MHRQPLDSLNDRAVLIDAIDGELRRALAVAPSVEFTARLRQRVAQEPSPAPGRAMWMVPIAALASIAVWLGLLVVRPPSSELRAPLTASSHQAGPAKAGRYNPIAIPPVGPAEHRAAVPPSPGRRVAEPVSRRIDKPDGRARSAAGIARETAVPEPAADRWESIAASGLVSDTSFAFPIAMTLESAPVVAVDDREPNEGLLEGQAATVALSYESPWSER